ncbi:biotin synthase BioB [Candidatus Poribacteria bacterium]|nr:biotin synthase BioB [Candidatus Poribacteria bacterium]
MPITTAAPHDDIATADASEFIDDVCRPALDGKAVGFEDAVRLMELDATDVPHLLSWANRIRARYHGSRIHLCSIVNAKSGGCAEDCKFCSQSVLYQTGVDVYSFLGRDEALAAAQRAGGARAQALGIVAAWRGLKEGRLLDQVCERISDVSGDGSVRADASLGIIEDVAVAERLRDAGLSVYNHNLESSRSFYPNVCTTHTYDDRVQTIRNMQAAGVRVCSGGIMGMGETRRQRVELAFELRGLDVDVVPINFLMTFDGTPFEDAAELTPMECLQAIAVYRVVMPTKEIMVAGGRERNLRDLHPMIFMAGASAMLIGHYLTSSSRSADDDLRMLEDLGLTWDWSPH